MAEPAATTFDGLCPFCKAPLGAGAVLCVKCGYHLERRTKLAVDVQPTMTVVRDPANPYRSPPTELGPSQPRERSGLRSLFSASGRIPRWQWWLYQVGFFVFIVVTGNLLKAQLVPEGFLVVSIWVYLGFFVLAQIKRWHDMDSSGWWVLINFVPLGSLYTFIVLGFVRGTDGPNQFGPDPLER
jgi:uncharacterized membrane protein YhaH (DUF805 family)